MAYVDKSLIEKINKTPLDEPAFKALVRVVKDFNMLGYFTTKYEIMTNCYTSRDIHVGKENGETLLQNMVFWGIDAFRTHPGINEKIKTCITSITIVKVINNNKEIIGDYIDEPFINTFFERLKMYFEDIDVVGKSKVVIYDDEINQAISILDKLIGKNKLLQRSTFEYKFKGYVELRNYTIEKGFLKL